MRRIDFDSFSMLLVFASSSLLCAVWISLTCKGTPNLIETTIQTIHWMWDFVESYVRLMPRSSFWLIMCCHFFVCSFFCLGLACCSLSHQTLTTLCIGEHGYVCVLRAHFFAFLFCSCINVAFFHCFDSFASILLHIIQHRTCLHAFIIEI